MRCPDGHHFEMRFYSIEIIEIKCAERLIASLFSKAWIKVLTTSPYDSFPLRRLRLPVKLLVLRRDEFPFTYGYYSFLHKCRVILLSREWTSVRKEEVLLQVNCCYYNNYIKGFLFIEILLMRIYSCLSTGTHYTSMVKRSKNRALVQYKYRDQGTRSVCYKVWDDVFTSEFCVV